MRRILFERLEKRFSTQAVFPVNSIPGIADLEKWIGQSIQNRAGGAALSYQGMPSWSYVPGPAYESFPSSWSAAGSFSLSLMPYRPSWTYPSASQSYPWTYQTYPWYSMNRPENVSWQTFRPFTSMMSGFWGSLMGYTGGTSASDTPYPPGTRYGLIKRAHLTG